MKDQMAAPSSLVEPDNAGDGVEAEVGEVGLRTVERISVLNLGVRVGTAERQEATRHQPVEVPVLDLFNSETGKYVFS